MTDPRTDAVRQFNEAHANINRAGVGMTNEVLAGVIAEKFGTTPETVLQWVREARRAA